MFAFTSLYGRRRIQNACALTYCTGMKSLSSTGCYNLARWFPQDEQALKDVAAAAKLEKNQVELVKHDHMQRRISSKADIYFLDIVSRPDVKNRSKFVADEKSGSLRMIQDLMAIETFLNQREISCLSIKSSQATRLTFLHCLVNESEKAGEKNMVLLVRSSSLTKQVIYFAPSWGKESAMMRCILKHPGTNIVTQSNVRSFCEYYRTKYKINPITYPELSTLKEMKPETSLCVLASHPGFKYESVADVSKPF